MRGGSGRGRWLIFGVVVLVVAGATGIAVARAVRDQQQRARPTVATAQDRALNLGTVLQAPHIVFRSTSPGPTAGMLAAVPLAAPGGERSVSELSCQRVYATSTEGVCLAAKGSGLGNYYQIMLDGSRLMPAARSSLAGSPSRARLSTDGSLLATTVFVSGHSYATVGFSTETVITDLRAGTDYGNIEKTFQMVIDPRRNHAPDLNVWGVTFLPGPHPSAFYATVSAGGETWLARGDLRTLTLTAVRPDGECPSLSPNGRTLVYKKRAGSAINWRYHALDLATGREWALPETRSVDDQVEWLDTEHVLYGVPRATTGDADIWVADIRGGAPRILIQHAESPAVVR